MAKVAVLIDLSFFLKRYNKVKRKKGAPPHSAAKVARSVWGTAVGHLQKNEDALYRILVYDCHPFAKKAHNPITGKSIDFGRSSQAQFRREVVVLGHRGDLVDDDAFHDPARVCRDPGSDRMRA